MTRNPRTGRGGFTLIEVLVVISIIAILMGLSLVAFQTVRRAGERTNVRNDLSQMAAAVKTFEETLPKSTAHVPSRLLLREDGNYADPNIPNQYKQLALDSRDFLKKCFPGCNLFGMDWSASGQNQQALMASGLNGMYILEGQQCLVFFLGGIEGKYGFSTNSQNPTDGRKDRIGPFFTFKSERLVGPGSNPPTGATYYNAFGKLSFPQYNDPYGMPYAFFSSYKRDNGYNKYGSSDCPFLGVSPYIDPKTSSASSTGYYNPKSFQIICAGRDKLFGPGGPWPPLGSPAAADDMTNFSSGMLGSN